MAPSSPGNTLAKCCVALGTKLTPSRPHCLPRSYTHPSLASSSIKGKVLYRAPFTVPSNPVTQMVNMHMEKVARREIGTLATVQRLPPSQKIIAPESLPPLTPYFRKPLNFGCLDDIGHGIKVRTGAPPLSPQPRLLPHGSLLSRPPVFLHTHVLAPTP